VANATDGLTPPAGVVDWIAIGAGGGIVVNLADVAVLVGVALCARTVYRLAAAIRREHVVRRAVGESQVSSRTSDASVGIYV
ncbi:MAG: hypothetical protein ABR499_05760, partial [Gemmatimonadaceae bacterium]